ncbi:bifunctional metallophosphatase/5'-nucleotidase [Zhouia amylolytica]|uniref:5'-nucleotidase/2',3'-cyclic phosphodiesterase-like hydrolase n=1 Tax=Zhouia amylolytica AD3 TaxID=1286632 RepID=W2UQ73_9FLAO|nr:metallophosphatase [Zhouia amylolytica]ETN95651.1 5'-nucleotidase/2',3'-cyclic phosphodiesterase-like hydrolase [Zhouia amylolytica AD3]
MKRRNFIQNTIASSAFLGLAGLSLNSCNENSKKHITILHTNDVHSHIDPFPKDHGKNPNQGGVARRATLVDNIRRENPNTLLFDAGDIFQGTPYFNFYGGELEFKLMSMLKYDAATIGNHDFDNGIDGLYAQLPHAKFQFLSANYDFKNTIMDSHVKPYTIFIRDQVKIGVFGLGIELDGLVDKSLYKETIYNNPIEIAQDISRVLKEEENCDIVVCLSHLGYKYNFEGKVSDILLARNTEHIDLIIGGHTHTFMEQPEIVLNRKEKEVLINQAGCFGIYMGRIDFFLDKDKNIQSKGVTISV